MDDAQQARITARDTAKHSLKLITAGFAVALLFPSNGHAAACHKGGDMVTVVGTIHMRTLPPDPDMNRTKPWTYPVMTFDQPVCVKDADFGDVPQGKVASVFFTPSAKRTLAEGQHVSLLGSLSARSNGAQPPEPLILTVGN